MAYKLEGSLLEVCNCEVLCPCWIGVDPDNGTCDSALAHHFEKGEIDGVDVSGLTMGFLVHIPGNVLKGNWRVVVHIDQRATKEQEAALLDVYTGKQGGPVADLVKLIGEVVSVQRSPINSIFSTIPGSPAYIAKASKYKMNNPALGQNIDLKDHNAIQGKFVFQT